MFVIAALTAMLVHRLRLPLIIAYIVTGGLLGPSLFSLTKIQRYFKSCRKSAWRFYCLLFLVELRNVKDVGGVAFATGVGQGCLMSVIDSVSRCCLDSPNRECVSCDRVYVCIHNYCCKISQTKRIRIHCTVALVSVFFCARF